MLAQWFPFNSGAASAPSFSTYRLRAASREACLAEINQVVLARAALDSVLLTFLMTSVFWLRGRAGESPPCVRPRRWSGSGCTWPSRGGGCPTSAPSEGNSPEEPRASKRAPPGLSPASLGSGDPEGGLRHGVPGAGLWVPDGT